MTVNWQRFLAVFTTTVLAPNVISVASGQPNSDKSSCGYFCDDEDRVPSFITCTVLDGKELLGDYTLSLDYSYNDERDRLRYVKHELGERSGRTLAVYYRPERALWLYDEEGSSGFDTKPGFNCPAERPLTGAQLNWGRTSN